MVVDDRVNDSEPEVAIRLRAPVVKVKPFEAVKVEENLPAPVTSRATVGAVLPMPTLWLVVSNETNSTPALVPTPRALVESDNGKSKPPFFKAMLPFTVKTWEGAVVPSPSFFPLLSQ